MLEGELYKALAVRNFGEEMGNYGLKELNVVSNCLLFGINTLRLVAEAGGNLP